jgi:hypothetical protein
MQNGHQHKIKEILERTPSHVRTRCVLERSCRLNLSNGDRNGALREWIDRVIVPALAEDYIRQSQQKAGVVPDLPKISRQTDEIAK